MLSISIQKFMLYRPFHGAIDQTLKILEKCWPFLYLNFTRVLQFSSTSPCLYTLSQNKRLWWCGKPSPPPPPRYILKGETDPNKLYTSLERHLSQSPIHFRQRQNILISQLDEQFSRNDSAMAPQCRCLK